MKKIWLPMSVGIIFALLASGCGAVKDKLPIIGKEKSQPSVEEKAYTGDKQEQTRSQAEIDKEVAAKTDDMVNKIRQGDWNGAITVGEKAYGLDPLNEAMLEILVDAYDYKNHLEGLNSEEKEKYIRAARSHKSLDPTNRYKKYALGRVLIEVGELAEGNKLALEALNTGPDKPREFMDAYGWGQWQAKNKAEALKIYTELYNLKPSTIFQLYRAGIVIEQVDKVKAINMYHTAIIVADSALTWEENRNNFSAVSLITKLRNDAEKAEKRLLAGGNAIDNNFSLKILENIRPEQYPLR